MGFFRSKRAKFGEGVSFRIKIKTADLGKRSKVDQNGATVGKNEPTVGKCKRPMMSLRGFAKKDEVVEGFCNATLKSEDFTKPFWIWLTKPRNSTFIWALGQRQRWFQKNGQALINVYRQNHSFVLRMDRAWMKELEEFVK